MSSLDSPRMREYIAKFLTYDADDREHRAALVRLLQQMKKDAWEACGDSFLHTQLWYMARKQMPDYIELHAKWEASDKRMKALDKEYSDRNDPVAK